MTTNATTPAADPRRREQISAFYAANAKRLQQFVSRRAGASADAIDDACQNAWLQLTRRPDITLDARGLGWLTTVATHEAWRLASTKREIPAGDFRGPADVPDEHAEPPTRDKRSAEDHALDHIEHDERVQLLATLKPRERQTLALKALGYSYREIADRLGITYTATNRAITEGRAALRADGRKPTTPERTITPSC